MVSLKVQEITYQTEPDHGKSSYNNNIQNYSVLHNIFKSYTTVYNILRIEVAACEL